MTTGEIIKDLLQNTGRSQADLARFLGVSSTTVNRWIPTDKKAGIRPSNENIRKIAEFFEVSIDIITGSAGNDGSDKYMQFLVKKEDKVDKFKDLLRTFGYTVDDKTIKWGSGIDVNKRHIKDYDELLRKIEKHIRIEFEGYY